MAVKWILTNRDVVLQSWLGVKGREFGDFAISNIVISEIPSS